ncbi:hypothetical protein [Emcibacter sp.]|uniref:hypothetical protein n=1 Tax=Emcibacter sp. TaxID=1979954 RepID=UPI002AA89DD0|nr:hypothetical protein [Emcibacter sp.]
MSIQQKMNIGVRRALLLSTAIGAGAVLTNTAFAAEMMLEEVIVTAQKREQGINDVASR